MRRHPAVPLPRIALLSLLSVAPGTTGPASLTAQEPREERPETAHVFLDCGTPHCNGADLRQQVSFVEYVNDPADAHVHVIVTARTTGAGGSEVTLDFVGRGRFEGLDDRLVLNTEPQAPDGVVLSGMVRALELGLARYLARMPVARSLRLRYAAGVAEAATAAPEHDPWNFWVFRARGSGSINGEESRRSTALNGSLAAHRVTEDLKVQASVRGRYSRDRFQLTDSTSHVSTLQGLNGVGLVVWSLGDHWSAGAASTFSHSTFSNLDLAVRLTPALEANVFPYAESARRQLRFLYTVGALRNDYAERTIFGKTAETRFEQSFVGSLDVKEDWGSAGAAVQLSHFLDDVAKNRIVLYGNVAVRLFRGLTLDVSGSASRIRDQVNLPAGGATPEEILLLRRELRTDFQYFFSVGLGFTFGSIYSTVVNPRLDNPTGGFIQIY